LFGLFRVGFWLTLSPFSRSSFFLGCFPFPPLILTSLFVGPALWRFHRAPGIFPPIPTFHGLLSYFFWCNVSPLLSSPSAFSYLCLCRLETGSRPLSVSGLTNLLLFPPLSFFPHPLFFFHSLNYLLFSRLRIRKTRSLLGLSV